MNAATSPPSSEPERDDRDTFDALKLKPHLRTAIQEGVRSARRSDNEVEEIFNLIQLIDNILSGNTSLTKQQVLAYCTNQRSLMKLYMNKMMEKIKG